MLLCQTCHLVFLSSVCKMMWPVMLADQWLGYYCENSLLSKHNGCCTYPCHDNIHSGLLLLKVGIK